MDENRDDILNDLIKYYDGDDTNTAADEAITDESVTGEVSDKTIRIPQKKVQTDSAALEGETVRIVQTAHTEHTADDEPEQEEVLGSLGLDGRPIDYEALEHTQVHEQEESEEVYIPEPLTEPEYESDEIYDDRHEGIWYKLKPLWATLIVSAIVIGAFKFYITDTGIIGAYKRNFIYNLSVILDTLGIDLYRDEPENLPVVGDDTQIDNTLVSYSGGVVGTTDTSDSVTVQSDTEHEALPEQYDSVKDKTVTIPFEEAGSSDFSPYGSGVVCAKSNYICFVNIDGKKTWESEMPITNPIVSAAGDYVAVASKNGTRINLYKNLKLCFSVDAENKIRSCDVSERGDVAVITDKTAYKGAVEIFNKNGEIIFSWSSGVNYITAVSMLSSRLAAISLVSAVSDVTSYVMMFDVHSSEPLSGVQLKNTLIFDSSDYKTNVFASGDNSISSVSSDGKINYDLRFDDVTLTNISADNKGSRLVAYVSDNLPILKVFDRNGECVYDAQIEAIPDYTDIYGSTVLYNNGRDVLCGKYTTDTRASYTAPVTIKGLQIINSSTYLIIYEDSLEIVKF